MPLRPAWNAIEPSVYLSLFGWLAPLKEGRGMLKRFSDLVDPKYAHPTYLAYVVLTPVKKIVEHLVDICFLEKILTDRIKTIRNNKLRHQATAYVARQYLEVLVWASQKKTLERKEDEELSGESIGQLDGVTKILLNLPREYQRWNKYYKKTRKSITPDSDDESEPPEHKRPFDVSQAIDPTFRQCVFPNNNTKKYKGMPSPLKLSESWDPLIITQRLISKQYDISLADMNDEPIESYKQGVKIENKARGSTTGGETTKTTEHADTDDEAIPRAKKRQKKTNGRKHKSTETAKAAKAKIREDETEEHHEENNETSDQEDEIITETEDSQPTNSITNPDEIAEILKGLICQKLKQHMRTNTRCTPEVITFANELTQELTEYITNQRPTECSIAMEDIEDRQPRTSTRIRK
jgi:hypothetical protein